jgi:hypothetical protein
VVKLPVLGSYSATAPYDCPKSRRILERLQGAGQAHGRAGLRAAAEPDPRALNALALLASGEPGNTCRWSAARPAGPRIFRRSIQTWYYGYVIMLLAEYQIATGDDAFMPGMRRLALEAAKGQSIVGSWGHKFAGPDGRLGRLRHDERARRAAHHLADHGAPGRPEGPALDLAIERSAKLLRFYIGKGAVPYGDHAPVDANPRGQRQVRHGRRDVQSPGRKNGAEFFSRMSVASHGPSAIPATPATSPTSCGRCPAWRLAGPRPPARG